MSNKPRLSRTALLLLLLASLGACTIVPAHPYAGRSAPVYVDSYPSGSYGRPYGHSYYYGDHRPRHDHPHGAYRGPEWRDDRHKPQRHESTVRIPSPLEVHRDVRRSLGLPRLPGMP